jgi:hypothetical protein
MRVPILNGVYTDQDADFRTSYPRNLQVIPKSTGISDAYLRPAPGIVGLGTGPGIDRGGIAWRGVCYRVMGTKLVSILENGTTTILGDVGGSKHVSFDYSFDRLAIASNNDLFYWSGSALTQVTDPDLGNVVDMIWIDGYFMTTDGENIIVTDLNDPYAVNPLKYGSSEVDPDPVLALLELMDEVYALNRNTIEVLKNVGGDLFPFVTIPGAQCQKGVVGTHACCVHNDSIAFVGSGRNEAVAVYFALNGETAKISTREIDQTLEEYTESELSLAVVESKVSEGNNFIFIHLSNQTLCYDSEASKVAKEHIWTTLTSTLDGIGVYRSRNLVFCYNQWLTADPTSTSHGYLVNTISSHYGDTIGWGFSTVIIYNSALGAIFNSIELICLSGRAPFNPSPVDVFIFTSYSLDGQTWSVEKPCKAGKFGQRNIRVAWFQQGNMRKWRIQRFRGTSDSHSTIAAIEAQLEPLYV